MTLQLSFGFKPQASQFLNAGLDVCRIGGLGDVSPETGFRRMEKLLLDQWLGRISGVVITPIYPTYMYLELK